MTLGLRPCPPRERRGRPSRPQFADNSHCGRLTSAAPCQRSPSRDVPRGATRVAPLGDRPTLEEPGGRSHGQTPTRHPGSLRRRPCTSAPARCSSASWPSSRQRGWTRSAAGGPHRRAAASDGHSPGGPSPPGRRSKTSASTLRRNRSGVTSPPTTASPRPQAASIRISSAPDHDPDSPCAAAPATGGGSGWRHRPGRGRGPKEQGCLRRLPGSRVGVWRWDRSPGCFRAGRSGESRRGATGARTERSGPG
jgi:hypothetical protein